MATRAPAAATRARAAAPRPAAARGRRRSLPASPTTTVRRKVTTFTSLAISGLPKSAKVKVACKGSGCAGKSKTLKHGGGKLNVLKALKKLKLKAGSTLVVSVKGDGGAQTLAKFVIRAGKRPGVSYRCAKAGGKLAACS